MKFTFTLFLVAAGIIFVSAQQTAYQYSYDDAGNRIRREMIILPPMAPGSGGTALMEVPLVAQMKAADKSAETATRNDEGLELALYPNPTTSAVNVKFNKTDITIDEVRIIDNNGKIMYSQKNLIGDFEVPFDGLTPGVYFLWLRMQDEVKRFQVVKQ